MRFVSSRVNRTRSPNSLELKEIAAANNNVNNYLLELYYRYYTRHVWTRSPRGRCIFLRFAWFASTIFITRSVYATTIRA